MQMWNLSEGGPCFLRPTPTISYDNPAAGKTSAPYCVVGHDENGQCIINQIHKCRNAWCDEHNVVHGVAPLPAYPEATGPWTEDLSDEEKIRRHCQGWSNQFAFPWEIGMYWNITVGGNSFYNLFHECN